MESRFSSWKVIIFLLIIFWPIGLYLLYRKYANDKSAIFKNNKKLKNVAYILIGIGIVAIVMGLTGNLEHGDTEVRYTFWENVEVIIFYLIIFVGGGKLLLNKVQKVEIQAEHYRKLLDIVINLEITSISKIASMLLLDESTVKDDLQKMIDLGYFKGTYLDMKNNEIVLKDKENNTRQENKEYVERVVVCPSCGARNIINTYQISQCEYCDSYLEGELKKS